MRRERKDSLTDRFPLGQYELLMTKGHSRLLDAAAAADLETVRAALEPTDAQTHLARRLHTLFERVLASVPTDARPKEQVRIFNLLLQTLQTEMPEAFDGPDDYLPDSAELLLEVRDRPHVGLNTPAKTRPTIPLSSCGLLVNGRDEPSIGAEIARELDSADRVDLLCAFLKWQGIKVIEDALKGFFARGGELRVITTTYMGATERRALDDLASMGAEIAVSYDNRSTRLHAKAWLFHRKTGFSTAYIGSSNLSRSALVQGLEWNVRVSAVALPNVVSRFEATFESYWHDSEFERYDPARDGDRFSSAVDAQRAGRPLDLAWLEVHPYPFQQEILEKLQVERERHDRWRNLVVAATGTGKTVIAALDYRRLKQEWPRARLLFVAHRKEILEQSVAVFRQVLRDPSFGELHVGGAVPEDGQYVFASIQSLHALGPEHIPHDFFDVVIVDEFHHAEAQTYRTLLNHLAPKLLLGLTATPERADGKNVADWFGGRIAAQLRLWEALERGLLCPFQYFGVADSVDLRSVRWLRGGYDQAQMDQLYTHNDARMLLVLDALRRHVVDCRAIRALGFCVSVNHARYMAEGFSRAGIPSLAVSADSPRAEREDALRMLRSREANVLFAVDLFNEGVDVPEIDTVLFLRPTESVTVFLQQLGRGLRRCEGKACLTVLDFIGQQSEKFRFDLRFKALGTPENSPIVRQVENGFPYLPPGCQIILDKVSRERVLQNVREALRLSRTRLVEALRGQGDVTLGAFLAGSGMDVEDVYRGSSGSWSELRREAGCEVPGPGPSERLLQRALRRMLHIDDEERLDYFSRTVALDSPPDTSGMSVREVRLLGMLHFALWGKTRFGTLAESLASLWAHPAVRLELGELLEALSDRADHVPGEFRRGDNVPLWLHCRYSREEALAALGLSSVERPLPFREGVIHDKTTHTDAFFITRNKSEREFSPSTMYEDYAIAPGEFHWQSQSTTSDSSPTGRRYRDHVSLNNEVLLFVRETNDGPFGALPYTFLGPVDYLSHTGSRPMSIKWKLHVPMPADVFERMRVVGG